MYAAESSLKVVMKWSIRIMICGYFSFDDEFNGNWQWNGTAEQLVACAFCALGTLKIVRTFDGNFLCHGCVCVSSNCRHRYWHPTKIQLQALNSISGSIVLARNKSHNQVKWKKEKIENVYGTSLAIWCEKLTCASVRRMGGDAMYLARSKYMKRIEIIITWDAIVARLNVPLLITISCNYCRSEVILMDFRFICGSGGGSWMWIYGAARCNVAYADRITWHWLEFEYRLHENELLRRIVIHKIWCDFLIGSNRHPHRCFWNTNCWSLQKKNL